MTELIQALIFGVLTGSVYALMATGLTLTFGVMKIVNLAQGAFLILSAYLCYTLWERLGIDPLLGSLIVTVPLGVLGVLSSIGASSQGNARCRADFAHSAKVSTATPPIPSAGRTSPMYARSAGLPTMTSILSALKRCLAA